MRLNGGSRTARKAAIKLKAQQVIYSRYPQWRQNNILASGDGEAITKTWAWIDTVRAYSNTLEAHVDNGVAVDLEAGWPT